MSHPSLVVKGYQAAITQVGVGIGVNWLAEFAPEIQPTLPLEKKKATPGKILSDILKI